MSWSDKYRILAYRINPADYPDYTRCDRVSDVPGLVLSEHYALRGIRYAVTVGCGLSVLYFYGVVRPRMAFADRSLVKLHHYFYPSAGYTTPIGLCGGLAYGVYAEGQWVDLQSLPRSGDTSSSPALSQAASVVEATVPLPNMTWASALARGQMLREYRAAAAAATQHERRRQDLSEELRRGGQAASLWSSLRRALGIGADPVAAQMEKLGFGATKKWTAFLQPYGLVWTRLHSSVHDTRFYKNYTGPIVVEAEKKAEPSTTESSGTKKRSSRSKPTADASAAAPDPASVLPVAGPPPARALFTKEQVDVVVSRASTLRHSPDESRWTRSGGRFATYGIATTVLAWNSGNLLFRVTMGLGLGVVAGAMVSATRLDDAFKHL